MEVRKVTCVYKDKFITVLFDKDEVVVLYGPHVGHFNTHTLEDWIKLGLLLDLYLGSEKREEIQNQLLEMYYQEELGVKFLDKDKFTAYFVEQDEKVESYIP